MDEADPRPGFTGMNFLAGTFAGFIRGGRGGGPDQQRTIPVLGGWAVGGSARELPDGLARRLRKDSDLVIQMHFHPAGKVEREQATLGFYFADEPPKRTLAALQLPVIFGAFAGIESTWRKTFRHQRFFYAPDRR